MITLLLFGHITLGILSLCYAGGVVMASRKRNLDLVLSRTKWMWYGTVTTIGSGIGLAFLTGSSVGRACVTLLSFQVVVLAAHLYQKSIQKSVGADTSAT